MSSLFASIAEGIVDGKKLNLLSRFKDIYDWTNTSICHQSKSYNKEIKEWSRNSYLSNQRVNQLVS